MDARNFTFADDDDTCKWNLGPNGHEPWLGTCGAAWSLNDGGPVENGMNFCPVCGKPLEVVERD